MHANPWDERYGSAEYIYGTEPNDWVRENAPHIPSGPVLCLADGEGRNGVHLASLGHDVTSVDASVVGLGKARELARDRGVELTTVHADLTDFDLGEGAWAGVVSVFCHVPAPVRRRVHADMARALVPGGVLILEAYTPQQLDRGTGGPPVAELMVTADELRQELPGLELEVCRERVRSVVEGTHHRGEAAVVQLLGFKR